MIDRVYIFWLILVVLWNVMFPKANPWLDILVAVVLSLLSYKMRKK